MSVLLADGDWVQRGLIQVWQPDPRFADLIACPVCRATVTDHCPHPERLVSRRCVCGEVPVYFDGSCGDDDLTCARRRREIAPSYPQNPHSLRVSGAIRERMEAPRRVLETPLPGLDPHHLDERKC